MKRKLGQAITHSPLPYWRPSRAISTNIEVAGVHSYSTQESKISINQAIQLRNSRAAQAVHLKPLKRTAEYGIPSCDLQLRSFSLQPLDFFADFSLRAAYYLGLSALGPIPLPRIIERWTVPRDHFIFKKSQENFERITLRRLIQIQDGNPETVQLWLAYLRKHQYYGVGMKANVWEFGKAEPENKARGTLESELRLKWDHLGQTRRIGAANKVSDLLSGRRFKEAAAMRGDEPLP